MIRGFFYKFNRSFKNLQNVVLQVKLLSSNLRKYDGILSLQFGNQHLATAAPQEFESLIKCDMVSHHQYCQADFQLLSCDRYDSNFARS